jgi:hypothetical protein
MRSLIATSALLLLAACVNYQGAEPTRTLEGEYVLGLVNGARPPVITADRPHERIFLDSARLVLGTGGWAERMYFTRTRTALATDYAVQSNVGTWTYDPATGAVTLIGREGISIRNGTAAGSTLTFTSPNPDGPPSSFVYQR